MYGLYICSTVLLTILQEKKQKVLVLFFVENLALLLKIYGGTVRNAKNYSIGMNFRL